MLRGTHQETGRNRAHSRQVRNSRATAQDQHRRDDDIGSQSEKQEDNMGELAPPRSNDLEETGMKTLNCHT